MPLACSISPRCPHSPLAVRHPSRSSGVWGTDIALPAGKVHGGTEHGSALAINDPRTREEDKTSNQAQHDSTTGPGGWAQARAHQIASDRMMRSCLIICLFLASLWQRSRRSSSGDGFIIAAHFELAIVMYLGTRRVPHRCDIGYPISNGLRAAGRIGRRGGNRGALRPCFSTRYAMTPASSACTECCVSFCPSRSLLPERETVR